MKKALLWMAVLLPAVGHAAKIGDISETTIAHQALRFIQLQDPSTRYALAGSILLGICCGLLGSFIVVRKMALMGDALSHAVLPGVAAGYLWNMTKDPVSIFVGATLAGLLGSAVVGWIKHTTRIKEDAALGLVLSSFFALGMAMMTMIQRLPAANKSGLDKFLFGQAAALGADDVQLMAIVTVLALLCVFLLFKELVASSFDPVFTGAIGFPVRLIHHMLMLLLAFAIVISLQAVGVVLVSAMLITPAAAAYLLTERMTRMVVLAVVFGVLSGILGAFASFLGNNLPTGPFMVLAASLIFLAAFLFSPRHGVVSRWLRHRSGASRTRRENTLKAVYHVLEDREFQREAVTLQELAERRRETLDEVEEQVGLLVRHGLATLHKESGSLVLTRDGWERACEIVRNHRLWELYLTNAAQFQSDHVHDDAEVIEHILGEELVRQLERQLNYARLDPHGRKIPGIQDIHVGACGERTQDRTSGYGAR